MDSQAHLLEASIVHIGAQRSYRKHSNMHGLAGPNSLKVFASSSIAETERVTQRA